LSALAEPLPNKLGLVQKYDSAGNRGLQTFLHLLVLDLGPAAIKDVQQRRQ
jgi:hypothetical protein